MRSRRRRRAEADFVSQQNQLAGINQTFLGGWCDTIDADENGDKCAWVGTLLDGGGTPNVMAIPGAVGDVQGNRGTTFPVQSLWSNDAAAGLGYCPGAGTDLPVG